MYRARDTRLGRTVAVKLPGAELQADRARLDALSSDARAASVLSHPNIAALYEIGDEDGRLFLVFEFVPGEPLKRVIAGRPLNMRRAVDLATQMADALADAHAAEVVHGDLTPDTVMVTPKGNAKILDFGFVRWKKSPTPGGESDHRTDIEALGALLFEMLTGRPPSRRRRGSAPRSRASSTTIVGKALGAYAEGGYEAAATLRGGAAIGGRDARRPRGGGGAGARRAGAPRAQLARLDRHRDRRGGRGVCGTGGVVAVVVRTTSCSAARSREFPAAGP